MHPGNDQRGQAAAIGAIVFFALAVIALALTQAVVVPQQNQQVEQRHAAEVQQDMVQVRGAILGSADSASSQTATITLGANYEERLLLRNPEPPQGQLEIDGIGDGSISNAVATDRETRDFWTGIDRSGYLSSDIAYSPGYNYYDGAPQTVYENTVLYNNRSGQITIRKGQRLIDGRELSLVFVQGERSISRSGTVTIEPRTLSASTVDVDLRSPDAEPMLLRIPTQLPAERWEALLADQYDPSGTESDAYVRSYACTGGTGDACGTLLVELEPGVTYDTKLTKVGLTQSTAEPAAYLTAVDDPDPVAEGTTKQFTVQLRDRYNNPVSGTRLVVDQPAAGTVTGPRQSGEGATYAITDADGRATFTLEAPTNVPVGGTQSRFAVRAVGVPGQKGRVDCGVTLQNTPEPVADTAVPPLVTAVKPDVTETALGQGGGDYVRLSVSDPNGIDPEGWTLDLQNRDDSVRNTLALGAGGRTVSVGPTGAVYVPDAEAIDGLPVTGQTTMNDLLSGPVDLYVVGPNADGGPGPDSLAAFAERNGLTDDGDEGPPDVVVRADALKPTENAAYDAVAGTYSDGFLTADTVGNGGTVDILDDRRGEVLLRDPPEPVDGTPSRVVDAFGYRSGATGRIGVLSPAAGGDEADEYVRVDFPRAVDLAGSDGLPGTADDFALTVRGDGRRETLPLGAFADTDGDGVVDEADGAGTGSFYVVGEAIDIEQFAAQRGVPTSRVRRASALPAAGATALATPGDVLADRGGVATLYDGAPGVDATRTLDRYPYPGVQEPAIGRVVPANATPNPGDTTDEFARLDFPDTTDTTGWTLRVDDGDGGVQALDLTGVASTTTAAPGPVYVVGSGVDPATFATERGLNTSRVVRASDLGGAGTDMFDDDGASLALVDVTDETVDRYSYEGGPEADIATVVPRDAVTGTGPTAEYARFRFRQPTNTTGWTLAVDDNHGTIERFTLGLPAARTTARTGQDLYLVGKGVDRAAFATEQGVEPGQVARISALSNGLADPDVLDDDGATLRLTDERGRPVDAYSYENDAAVSPGPGGQPGPQINARIDAADPTDATAPAPLGGAGDGPSDEWVRLSFPQPTDTTDWRLGTPGGEAIPLSGIAPQAGLGGPIYLVGDDLDVDGDGDSDATDRAAFADARGVPDERVIAVSSLTAGTEVDSADVLPTGNGVQTVTLTDGGRTVDRYTYRGDSAAGSGGALAASLPVADPISNGVGTRESLQLEFSRPLATDDLAGWEVTLATGPDERAGRIDLGALDDRAAGQRTVYLVGASVDPAAFAAERGVDAEQVHRFGAVDRDLVGTNVLPDAAGTLRVRDRTDRVRDRYDYRGVVGTGARIAGVDPVAAGGAGGAAPDSADEFVRLDVRTPTVTRGWTLSVEDGTTADTLPLADVSAAAAEGGPIFLVGDALDVDGDGVSDSDDIAAFAADRGVSTDRVFRATDLRGAGTVIGDPEDVFDDAGGTLVLRNGAGATVDRVRYEGDTTALIADVTPASAGDADREWATLSVAGDVRGWSLSVAGAEDSRATLTGDAFDAANETSLIGDYDGDGDSDTSDAAAFATDRGVADERVVSLGEQGLSGNVLPDAAGELVLSDGTGTAVDSYRWSSTRAAAITTVDPAAGGVPADEYAALSFGGPVDTADGWTAEVRALRSGPDAETVGTIDLSGERVDDAASTGGAVYLAGDANRDGRVDAADESAFADREGVPAGRVVSLNAPELDVAFDADAFADAGGELVLRDDRGDTVDNYAWRSGTAELGPIDPNLDDDTDRRDGALQVAFPAATDTTDWTVTVDTGSGVPVTLDLSENGKVDDRSRAGETVHVVGDYDDDGTVTAEDAAAYAADRSSVAREQVVTTRSVGGPATGQTLPDDGATVSLRDASGETVDTRVYGDERRSGRIAAIEPVDATGQRSTATARSSDEFVRLTFDRTVDTTGYRLRVRRPAGTRVDLSLVGASGPVAESGGPIYLIGDGVDADDDGDSDDDDIAAFAADRGVAPSRVVPLEEAVVGTVPASLTPDDLLPDARDGGALGGDLVLLDDTGQQLDRRTYGTERDPPTDEYDIGESPTDSTPERRTDDNGDYVDTDDDEDWYDGGDGTDPADVAYGGGLETVDADGDGDDDTVTFEGTNQGDRPVEVVGFTTETGLAARVNATDRGVGATTDAATRASAEAFVETAPREELTDTDGYARDTDAGVDGAFGADGTPYRFESGDWRATSENARIDTGGSVSLTVGRYLAADGTPAKLGTLEPATPATADLSTTLLFDDGTSRTFYFRQQPADMSVNVTALRDVARNGGTTTFRVTVENRGPGDAPGPIMVSDAVDNGLGLVSASPSAGRYERGVGWRLPAGLDAGENATLELTFETVGDAGERLRYGAARTASGPTDPRANNDFDDATVTIGDGADLRLEMDAARASGVTGDGVPVVRTNQGGTATFELAVTNEGPADATGRVRVTEELPDGFDYLASQGDGQYDSETGVWTVPAGLAAGESVTRTVTARVTLTGDRATSRARLTAFGGIDDTDATNDGARVVVRRGACSAPMTEGTVLLYSAFENGGGGDGARLRAAGWTGTGGGIAGVNDMTAASSSPNCGRSAYHADGQGAIRSPTVDTADQETVEVRYWVRPGDESFESTLLGSDGLNSEAPGPSETASLGVEYYGADGVWHRIETFEPSDPSIVGGVARRVYLPGPSARHDEFRLRFVQDDGDQNGDDPGLVDFWHVDDVRVIGRSADAGSVRPTVTDIERTVTGPNAGDGGDETAAGACQITVDADALVVGTDRGSTVEGDGRDVRVEEGVAVGDKVETGDGATIVLGEGASSNSKVETSAGSMVETSAGSILVGRDASVGDKAETSDGGSICMRDGATVNSKIETGDGGDIALGDDLSVGDKAETGDGGDVRIGARTTLNSKAETGDGGDMTVGENASVGGKIETGDGGNVVVGENATVGGGIQAGGGTATVRSGASVGGKVQAAEVRIAADASVNSGLQTGEDGDVVLGPGASVGGAVSTGWDGDVTLGTDASTGGKIETGENGDVSLDPQASVGGPVSTGEGGDVTVGEEASTGSVAGGTITAPNGRVTIEANANVGGGITAAAVDIADSATVGGAVDETGEVAADGENEDGGEVDGSEDADGSGEGADGSPGTDDRGHGNNCGSDPENPSAADPEGAAASGDCDEGGAGDGEEVDSDGSDGDSDDGSVDCTADGVTCTYTATFGYENTFDAPVYLAPGTGDNQFDLPVDATLSTAGDRDGRSAPGSAESAATVSGVPAGESATWRLGDGVARALASTADLRVSVELADDDPVVAGQRRTVVVQLLNAGPNDHDAPVAVAADVTDPAGLSPTGEASVERGSYEPSTGTWRLDSLDAGRAVRLRLPVRVGTTEPVTASAALDERSAFDPATDNEADELTIDASEAACTVHESGDALLDSDFDEATGDSDRERLQDACWRFEAGDSDGPDGSDDSGDDSGDSDDDSPAVGGVDDATSAGGSQSAYVANGPGSVVSPTVDAGDAGGVTLRYWVRPGADGFSERPSPDDQLAVEYRDTGGDWTAVARHDADSVDDAGETNSVELADAAHDDLAVRFRLVGGELEDGHLADFWHVDSVRLTSAGSDGSANLPPVDVGDSKRNAISFVAVCGEDVSAEDVSLTVSETKDDGEPLAVDWTSDEAVEDVVLKAGSSMEVFETDSTSGTAAVGEGSAAGEDRSPPSPCDADGGVKFDWEGDGFTSESGESDD